MRTKRIQVLVATGVMGLALGTGVGIAAARSHPTVSTTATISGSMMDSTGTTRSMMGGTAGAASLMGTTGSMHGGQVSLNMDAMRAMHAGMRSQMPASVRQRCDALHAKMKADATDSHAAHHTAG